MNNNNWILGYPRNPLDSLGGMYLDFRTEPPGINSFEIKDFPSLCTAVYNTEEGGLLYYSNGCSIKNRQFEDLPEADTINYYGESFEQFCWFGADLVTSPFFLPAPGNDKYLYLFYLHKEWNHWVPPYIFVRKFYMAMIDNTGDNGRGSIVFKDSVVLNGFFDYGYSAAVKHANGRDWWILVPNVQSNEYNTILVTKQGISQKFVQSAGPEYTWRTIKSEGLFTPDGSKYMRMNGGDKLNIYNFNRCTGSLSGHIRVDFPVHPDSSRNFGMAVSPNSELVYVSTDNYVYQFDLTAENIDSSKIEVARFDGFVFFVPTRFAHMELGPDGRIYITIPGSAPYLHVIEHPNRRGLECNVVQHGLELPAYNFGTLPSMPNYSLGALRGFPCDSADQSNQPPFTESEFLIYPNPAISKITLRNYSDPNLSYRFFLYDARGSLVIKTGLIFHDSKSQLDLGHLPRGIYFYEITNYLGEHVQEGKIVLKKG